MLEATMDLLLGVSCLGCARPGPLVCRDCRSDLPDRRAVRPLVTAPDPCPPGLAPVFVAGPYDGLLRELVLHHKERHGFGLSRLLGAQLALAARGAAPVAGKVLLVPVPSRAGVVAARGHDPMLRICRSAATRLRAGGVEAEAVRLLRLADRPADQSTLTAHDRLANLAGTMAARTSAVRQLARRGIPVQAVVCDDVLTTGATAREAQRALAAVGVPVAAVCCVTATQRRSRVFGRVPQTRSTY